MRQYICGLVDTGLRIYTKIKQRKHFSIITHEIPHISETLNEIKVSLLDGTADVPHFSSLPQ